MERRLAAVLIADSGGFDHLSQPDKVARRLRRRPQIADVGPMLAELVRRERDRIRRSHFVKARRNSQQAVIAAV